MTSAAEAGASGAIAGMYASDATCIIARDLGAGEWGTLCSLEHRPRLGRGNGLDIPRNTTATHRYIIDRQTGLRLAWQTHLLRMLGVARVMLVGAAGPHCLRLPHTTLADL
jgi:hypothetical protein